MSDTPVLQPARPLTLEEKLMKLIYGEPGLEHLAMRKLQLKDEVASEAPVTSLDSPIPGGNPEVPTGADALVGALLSMGGVPPQIARSGNASFIPPSPPRQPKRGEVRVYHGTSQGGFNRFARNKMQDALYGPGIYTTMDPEIAGLYTQKGGSPGKLAESILPMHLKPGKTLNLDKPVPRDLVEKVARVETIDYPVNSKGEPAFKNGDDLYNALVRHFGTRDDANDWLSANGVDTLTHIGGSISRGKPHRVFISLEGRGLKGAMSDKPVGFEDVIE